MYVCVRVCIHVFLCVYQEEKDQQWKQAMDYLSAVTELNYMTQIVIMLYEDNNKVSLQRKSVCLMHIQSVLCLDFLMFLYLCREQDPSSEERFHVELHFSPGVKGCEDEENVPLGFGFRPASSEVCECVCLPCMLQLHTMHTYN